MIPVKVVLASEDGEQELELGPFNQGVVIEPYGGGDLALIDIAGKKVVARCLREGIQLAGTTSIYARAFVQPAIDRKEIIMDFIATVVTEWPWTGLADIELEDLERFMAQEKPPAPQATRAVELLLVDENDHPMVVNTLIYGATYSIDLANYGLNLKCDYEWRANGKAFARIVDGKLLLIEDVDSKLACMQNPHGGAIIIRIND